MWPGILCVGENHQSEFGITVLVEMATGLPRDHGGFVGVTKCTKSVLLRKTVDYFFAIGIIGRHRTYLWI
jgi:hypothetical protein